MRTERHMLDLILETARNDERIRAVIMNGSRTNPNLMLLLKVGASIRKRTASAPTSFNSIWFIVPA